MRSFGFGFGRGVQGWSGGLVDLAVGILVLWHRATRSSRVGRRSKSGCVGEERRGDTLVWREQDRSYGSVSRFPFS